MTSEIIMGLRILLLMKHQKHLLRTGSNHKLLYVNQRSNPAIYSGKTEYQYLDMPRAGSGPGFSYGKRVRIQMMRKVFVFVSAQDDAEKTIRFARACCSYVRETEKIPIADQYLFHDEGRNIRQIEDLNIGHEYLVDIRICRELMMLCDEVWVFLNRQPDDPVIMILSMADELEMEIHIFRKEELCQIGTI